MVKTIFAGQKKDYSLPFRRDILSKHFNAVFTLKFTDKAGIPGLQLSQFLHDENRLE